MQILSCGRRNGKRGEFESASSILEGRIIWGTTGFTITDGSSSTCSSNPSWCKSVLNSGEFLTGKAQRFKFARRMHFIYDIDGAYQSFLSRYTGQDDIIVGSPIANRNVKEIEGLIGFFANTLVYRADFSGNPTFQELLSQVRKSAKSIRVSGYPI